MRTEAAGWPGADPIEGVEAGVDEGADEGEAGEEEEGLRATGCLDSAMASLTSRSSICLSCDSESSFMRSLTGMSFSGRNSTASSPMRRTLALRSMQHWGS